MQIAYSLKISIADKEINEFSKMDETKFEELYEKMARPLWSYISRVSGNTTLADDIVQETFLRFLRSPIADEQGTKSYLYRIATNLVYDHFRRAKRENNLQIDSVAENISAKETFMEETEMMQVFHKLKPQERALLWLAYVEGYEHREIASVLRLSPMSIRVLLFRARRKLAGLFEGKNEIMI